MILLFKSILCVLRLLCLGTRAGQFFTAVKLHLIAGPDEGDSTYVGKYTKKKRGLAHIRKKLDVMRGEPVVNFCQGFKATVLLKSTLGRISFPSNL